MPPKWDSRQAAWDSLQGELEGRDSIEIIPGSDPTLQPSTTVTDDPDPALDGCNSPSPDQSSTTTSPTSSLCETPCSQPDTVVVSAAEALILVLLPPAPKPD